MSESNIDTLDTAYFNTIFNKIIDLYNRGVVDNATEFLEYLHREGDSDSEDFLKYIQNTTSNRNFYRPQLNYQQRYFAEIFYNMISDAVENGLISNADDFVEYISNRQDISNYYVMTLAIISDTVEDVYYDLTDVYDSSKIEYAIGSDLDSIGEIVGCPRPQATKAGVNVTFTMAQLQTTTKTIPAGTIVSTRTGITYVTLEDKDIPIGEFSVDVYCESTDYGSAYRVLSNSIVNVELTLDGVSFRVNNNENSSGGREAYTDEEYRTLLLDWVKNNTKGSREAYERYFSTFDGIDGYKLIPNWNGSGTLKIVIDPGYPYQLNKAYNEINESVCQLPDDITMWSPTRVPISVYCSVNVDIDQVNPYSESEKEEIKSKIIDAIYLFVDGDTVNYSGLGIGEDFVPHQLGVFISLVVPEVQNINFYESGDKFCKWRENTKDEVVQLLQANPVSINDEEIGFIESVTVNME